MLRKILLALTLLSLPVLPPVAQVRAETPTITVSKSDSIALALTPISGSEGELVTSVLRNDLSLAGYFNLVSGGQPGLTVSGSDSGGVTSGRVTDFSGGTVLQRQYRGDARQRAHAFARDIIETLTGNPGLPGSRIAFVATRTGRKEIYTADYDGSNVRQLTHDGNISVAPALSADGRRLAYTGYLKGYADIYTIELGSGARRRVVKFPGTNSGATWSPDGSRLACTVSRDGNPELYIVSASGSGAQRLTHTSGVESSPSWSPDGQEIVYAADNGGAPRLYRISANGGRPRPVASGYRFTTEPDWSPDGKKIAFNLREGGGFRVAVHDLASGQTQTLSSAGSNAQNPVWGPDSRHLLFTDGPNLVMIDSRTGRRTTILDGLGAISEPAWSR